MAYKSKMQQVAAQIPWFFSAMDELLRHPEDRPSIGLILCKSRNQLIAEYALRDMNKPISIAGYRLTKTLPPDLQETLPSIEELRKELGYGG